MVALVELRGLALQITDIDKAVAAYYSNGFGVYIATYTFPLTGAS